MKAITQIKYGSPADVLEVQGIDKPEIKDDEVLVEVRAAGIHIGDWLVISGLPYLVRLMGFGILKPKNLVPGMEMAGVVSSVGADVTQFKQGDQVFGWCKGAFAEYAAVSEDALVLMPNNATFEQAAALPISGFTGLQAIRDRAKVQQVEKVLVIGAAGGVGNYAVQIAKSYGAEVTGVCSTRSVELVHSIGADHVIDYTKEEITESGQQYDAIIDTAGNRSLSQLRSALTPKGKLVIVGGTGGKWFMGVGRSIRAQMLSPFISQSLGTFISKTTKEDLIVLKELVESGQVTPVIERTYALSDGAEAVSQVGERHSQGKLVITMSGAE
jgi:2-desacetyl-2-hydroxyethyl bacteriochlorophyllide A dehydrogenase